MLTDLRCRQAKGRDKPYKLTDERGLYLYVTPTGFRSWRLKYRFAEKEKRLTFGAYPEISLVEARRRRDDARELVRSGTDPSVDRKQRAAEAVLAAETTFRAVAVAWHDAQKKKLKPRYAAQLLQRFENHVFPVIGSVPIAQVTAALVLQVIRAIETRDRHETAHRIRQNISDVFVFAIASGWAEDDPAHVIRKALVPGQKRLRPAVTKLPAARTVLDETEKQSAYAVTKLAARLLALTAARPGVLRLATPSEFEDLDGPAPLWRIPAAKMKLTREQRIDETNEFVIPLSRQAVELVKVALEIAGPKAPLLFPSVRDAHRPMSDSTLSKMYRDAGFRDIHVPHGWRSTFSTLMNQMAAENDRERDREVIDLMLAHVQGGVEPIYNRYRYMPRRRALAQEWADMLTAEASSIEKLIHEQRGSSKRAARRPGRDRRLASPVVDALVAGVARHPSRTRR